MISTARFHIYQAEPFGMLKDVWRHVLAFVLFCRFTPSQVEDGGRDYLCSKPQRIRGLEVVGCEVWGFSEKSVDDFTGLKRID